MRVEAIYMTSSARTSIAVPARIIAVPARIISVVIAASGLN
jgi:hypothetical protein